MQVMVFFSIHPIGEGAHVSEQVAKAIDVIEASGLEHQVGPSGTTILGEYDEVMDVIRGCHEALDSDGQTRVNSVLKIDWKPGLEPGAIQGKVDRVQEQRSGRDPYA